ncbi:hypothetical protein SUDANB19_01247 [Streptomyces sp. enrichment culture]
MAGFGLGFSERLVRRAELLRGPLAKAAECLKGSTVNVTIVFPVGFSVGLDIPIRPLFETTGGIGEENR